MGDMDKDNNQQLVHDGALNFKRSSAPFGTKTTTTDSGSKTTSPASDSKATQGEGQEKKRSPVMKVSKHIGKILPSRFCMGCFLRQKQDGVKAF
ncbi:hypothetical protein FRX31_033658 [Thalictrum thalictroides]|uniref:Uncharacterized protein n=1 Tax=Thalictrum thalictroides TaxID=46969 RepID=A0A7J6UVX2_THATH|nr:hypothetical protein FRX31_033658 [Thalictrum thalictroides]